MKGRGRGDGGLVREMMMKKLGIWLVVGVKKMVGLIDV